MPEAVVWSWYVNRNRLMPSTVTEAQSAPSLDGALGKLVKLIPVEAVTIFTGADEFARAAEGELRRPLLVAVAFLGLILVFGAFTRIRGVKWSDAEGRKQILIGALGYVIWVYAQGVLSADLGAYNALVAGVASFMFLGFAALVYGRPLGES